MNRMIHAGLAIFMGCSLSGCGTAVKTIQDKSRSNREGVFSEITEKAETPGGAAELIVRANIKTHHEGFYSLESSGSPHGKPTYLFIANIDGQVARWEVVGVAADNRTLEPENGPEAGNGMNYQLEKRIRLQPGTHEVFFSLPGDEYFVTRSISLREGKMNVLEFKPIYNKKRYPRKRTFVKGISTFDVWFNGELLADRSSSPSEDEKTRPGR